MSNASRSDAEIELGKFQIPFKFREHLTRGKTLAELLESDPRLLLDIARWVKPVKFAWAQAGIDRYLALPRVAQVLELYGEQTAERRRERCKTRTSGSHAERERQREFGL